MMKAAAFGQQLKFFWQPTIKKIPKWYLYELIHYLCLRYRLIRGDKRCNITSKGSCVKMRIDYQKAISEATNDLIATSVSSASSVFFLRISLRYLPFSCSNLALRGSVSITAESTRS